jgi:hypothetical protein
MKLKNYALAVLALTLLVSGNLYSQESVNLDAPVQAESGATRFRPGDLSISFFRKRIDVVFREVDSSGNFITDDPATVGLIEPDGRRFSCSWTVADGAVAMIRALNVANLSATSLEKRIMTAAQAHPNCLGSGSITGTPE